jgi:hypothetical protein
VVDDVRNGRERKLLSFGEAVGEEAVRGVSRCEQEP